MTAVWSHASAGRIPGFRTPKDEMGSSSTYPHSLQHKTNLNPMKVALKWGKLTVRSKSVGTVQALAAMGSIVSRPDLLLGAISPTTSALIPPANSSHWQLPVVALTEHCPQPQGCALLKAMPLPGRQPSAVTGWCSVWRSEPLPPCETVTKGLPTSRNPQRKSWSLSRNHIAGQLLTLISPAFLMCLQFMCPKTPYPPNPFAFNSCLRICFQGNPI